MSVLRSASIETPSTISTNVSGDMFRDIMKLGYSEVASRTPVHLYKPGTTSFTYPPTI